MGILTGINEGSKAGDAVGILTASQEKNKKSKKRTKEGKNEI
jgi:hypothetical protein